MTDFKEASGQQRSWTLSGTKLPMGEYSASVDENGDLNLKLIPQFEDSVRMSVNVNTETAAAARRWSAYGNVSITEGVRRAIGLWDFVMKEIVKGNDLAIVENKKNRVRVVELAD